MSAKKKHIVQAGICSFQVLSSTVGTKSRYTRYECEDCTECHSSFTQFLTRVRVLRFLESPPALDRLNHAKPYRQFSPGLKIETTVPKNSQLTYTRYTQITPSGFPGSSKFQVLAPMPQSPVALTPRSWRTRSEQDQKCGTFWVQIPPCALKRRCW